MNIKFTPTIVRQESSMPSIIDVLDAQYMNSRYPPTLIVHSYFIRNNIPNGMWIKCGIQWENGINENAWIEVIDSISDANGQRQYKQHLMNLI